MPERFIEQFHIIRKCSGKLDCLVKEMLYIRTRKPVADPELEPRGGGGGGGGLDLLALSAIFPSFLFFFFTQNKGGGGAGDPGPSPRSATVNQH